MQLAGELDGLSALTAGEAEQLLFAIQSSLSIRRRYQFYIWAQSRLNAMLPHDLLICAHADPARRGIEYDCFPMFPLPRETLERFYEPGSGVMARVLDVWDEVERTPCSSERGAVASARRRSLEEALASGGLTEFVAHGMPAPHDAREVESFFCFAQAADSLVSPHIKREIKPLSARHSFMLELLLPYLHATYRRVVGAERSRAAPRAEQQAIEMLITGREMEILGWVRAGKSNQEIGLLLAISPLTVKNHVQKILRKLGASNRAQAVSKAIGHGLIANGADGE